MENQNNLSKISSYVAWGGLTLFFLYQYILRVAPGVIINELRDDFFLTAEQFSYFGALYLYAYAFLQLPIGMAIDKYGIRKTVLTSIAICLGGGILFALSHNIYIAYIARIMIGAGSACAFMSTLKVVADSLPAGKRGFLMGATLTLGVVGALVAGKPLSVGVDLLGWRNALLVTMAAGGFVFIIVWLFVHIPNVASHNEHKQTLPTLSLFDTFMHIARIRQVVVYGLLAICLYTPLSVVADLWGVAYIMSTYDIPRTQAAEICMLMYVGLCVGSLLTPWLSEKYHFLNRMIRICCFGIFSLLALILFGPKLSLFQLSLSLFAIGVFCGAEMLCFTGVVLYAPSSMVGTTLGFTNTLNMLGGALAQQSIGFIIDKFFWSGHLDAHGNRMYLSQDYAYSLTLLLGVVGLCCFISFFLPHDKKEKITNHPH